MKPVEQTRGLRQGDLLLPLLFVICIKCLGHQIQARVRDGSWKAIKASRSDHKVSSRMSQMLGIPLISDIGGYLGHNIVHRGGSQKLHLKVMQKMQDRLEEWKHRTLSKAFRITLAKMVLSRIPTFYTHLECRPSCVYKQTDRLVRRCVWGELGQQR